MNFDFMWLLNSLVPASVDPNLAPRGESEQAWPESLEEGWLSL